MGDIWKSGRDGEVGEMRTISSAMSRNRIPDDNKQQKMVM